MNTGETKYMSNKTNIKILRIFIITESAIYTFSKITVNFY